eukprot:1744449-Amphidinium_carterae.1
MRNMWMDAYGHCFNLRKYCEAIITWGNTSACMCWNQFLFLLRQPGLKATADTHLGATVACAGDAVVPTNAGRENSVPFPPTNPQTCLSL